MLITIVVMAAVAFLAVTPFASAVAFEQVGSTILGCLSVIVAFQVIGRIGTWRWNVWDGRERVAARTGGRYPPLPRIVIQMSLLIGTILVAFLAIVRNEDGLALVALGGAALAVLLGIAVDVFDAARKQRSRPSDAMLPGMSRP